MALDGWKERLFRCYLFRVCRPQRVVRHLTRQIETGRPAPVPDRRRIRTAALQLEIKLFKNPLDYADEMHRRVREACDAGAHLAVFPENNNIQLLGILPGADKIGESAAEGSEEESKEEPEVTLADVIRYVGPVLKPLVHATFSTLAASYGLYIMAGSFLFFENNRVINRAYLYGPDGRLIGTQDKVHPLPIEEEFGVARGERFETFDTGLGKLALPVCMDASYFESFRILERMGAGIAMLPIANAEKYNYWLALRGIWPRVQESPLYGIKSAMVGKMPGFTFTGRAGIFAPMELTPDGSGILAEVKSPHREGMATAVLNLDALEALRRDHPWRDSNGELYRRYMPSVYRDS